MVPSSEAFFKSKVNVFLDALILKMCYFTIQITKYRGDLIDKSAKKASLDQVARFIQLLNGGDLK